MPPAKFAFCRSCNEEHSRPVGRNCRRNKVGDAAVTEVSVAQHVQPALSATPVVGQDAINSSILEKLSAISNQLSSLDGRVRATETSLAGRTTDLVTPTSATVVASTATSTAQNSYATGSTSSIAASQRDISNVVSCSLGVANSNIIPSAEFLKSNDEIQRKVDARFAELHNAQVAFQTTGKLKSQRGGASDVPIKRFVPWPQHYMLVGKEKFRPSYDQLTPIQWISGCIKGALDLCESDRVLALKYFSSLLEDASDFGFEGAKACHAVVLTSMEQDRLNWGDTLELDRLRRQHAQRHTPTPNLQLNGSSNKKSDSKNEGKDFPCKYYNDTHCSRHESHLTKGVWFLHICSKCRGNHKAKNCPGTSKN